MSVHFLGRDKNYYVYALLCKDADGPGYIKFGRSGNITSRLSSVKVGCPIPVKYIATAKMLNYEVSKKVEREFPRLFKSRRGTGEWSRFDFANNEDKKEFNDGSRTIFTKYTGPTTNDLWWEIVSVRVLDAIAKEKRDGFLRSKYRRKIEFKAYMANKRAMAHKELAEYGVK